MMGELISILISAPIGGILVAAFNWWKDRKRTKSDVELQNLEGAKIVQGMSFEMLQTYVEDQERLKQGAANLRKQVKDLREEVDQLIIDVRKERRARMIAEDERDRMMAERDYYKALSGHN